MQQHPARRADDNTFSHLLLESLAEGVFGIDRAGQFTFLNPAALAHLGYTSDTEMLGKSSHQLTHHTRADGRAFPEAECPIYQVMRSGEPLEAWEDLFWRADGTSFAVEVFASPIRGTDGTVDGAVVVFSDISGRKHREENLRKYHLAFQQSRDAVIFLDPSGLLDVNPAAIRIFQARASDNLLGVGPETLFPSRDSLTTEKSLGFPLAQALEDGRGFFVWNCRTLEGNEFPAEILLSRIDLSRGPVVEAVVRDFSDQKRAFKRVRDARQLAEKYFQVARVMMLVLDAEGQVSDINQRGAEMLGLPREKILGQDWFSHFIPPGNRDHMQTIFRAILRGEYEIDEYWENDILTASGEHRLMAFRNTLLHDDEGRIEGVLTSGEDITRQRQLEEQLEYQATHDGLTGALNRRHFERLMEQEIERSRRYAHPLSLLMFDIDHFKAVNDQYGHVAGDEVLKTLTQRVERRLRKADLFGRWGGEEFVALLPETSAEGAYRLAEDIRRAIAETDFEHAGHLTISLGAGEYRPGEELKDFIRRIDDALYRAKDEGRNRTVSAPRTPR